MRGLGDCVDRALSRFGGPHCRLMGSTQGAGSSPGSVWWGLFELAHPKREGLSWEVSGTMDPRSLAPAPLGLQALCWWPAPAPLLLPCASSSN